MTEDRARQLASFLRGMVGVVAIAVSSLVYDVPPRAAHAWVVVANGTVIRSPEDLT